MTCGGSKQSMTCGGLRAATTACALVLLAMPTSCRSFESPTRLFESETVDATGDSNLVADKTIDNSHRKKVPQQKARRHAPASPPLVVSDEMTPLGPANRHPAIPQKLPTSKQPTPPAAPASAPPLSSTLIAPSPLSLNLPYINPPSQTGDSHLVAYTTITVEQENHIIRE